MELAVLAAGVNAGREIGQEGNVEETAGEFAVQDLGVHAGDDGLKAQRDELAGEPVGRDFPEREYGLHPHFGQVVLAVLPQVLQKNVGKDHRGDAAPARLFHLRLHPRLVFLVRGLRRDIDLDERQPERERLGLQQLPPHPVHAHAVIPLRDRGEQSGDVILFLLPDFMQGQRAVLAPAPVELPNVKSNGVRLKY